MKMKCLIGHTVYMFAFCGFPFAHFQIAQITHGTFKQKWWRNARKNN